MLFWHYTFGVEDLHRVVLQKKIKTNLYHYCVHEYYYTIFVGQGVTGYIRLPDATTSGPKIGWICIYHEWLTEEYVKMRCK